MTQTQALLTAKELATRWGLSERTILNFKNSGKLPPAVLVGKRLKYRLSDIEAYEEQMIQKPKSKP